MSTATTRQGWPVQLTSTHVTPLRWVKGQVLKGDAYVILDELCRRFHTEVEPIIYDHSWGWNPRPVRGTTSTWSEHASGTAVDLNSPAHWMGLTGTFTKAQEAAIRRILADLGNVVVWGGTWTARPDEMHFELRGDQALVRKVAAAIRAGKSAAHPEPVKPSTNPIGVRDTASVVQWLADRNRDSSFTARAKLAAGYGITGYRGTAAQNLTLLSHLRADEDGTGATYTVNKLHKDGVNVRTGPGREHPILGLAPVGTTITTTGKTSGNYAEGATPYMLSHGQTGWMHTAHLDKKA